MNCQCSKCKKFYVDRKPLLCPDCESGHEVPKVDEITEDEITEDEITFFDEEEDL